MYQPKQRSDPTWGNDRYYLEESKNQDYYSGREPRYSIKERTQYSEPPVDYRTREQYSGPQTGHYTKEDHDFRPPTGHHVRKQYSGSQTGHHVREHDFGPPTGHYKREHYSKPSNYYHTREQHQESRQFYPRDQNFRDRFVDEKTHAEQYHGAA